MKLSTRLERQQVVEMLLSKLGISSTKLGFLYLSVLITQAWQDRETSPNPFQIYGNRIAKEANVFSGHIYANMKYAIEEAWFLGNYKLIEAIFGYSLMSLITEEPSPNKFIHDIVVALLALERNDTDIPAFLQFMEQDGYLLKILSSYQEDNGD